MLPLSSQNKRCHCSNCCSVITKKYRNYVLGLKPIQHFSFITLIIILISINIYFWVDCAKNLSTANSNPISQLGQVSLTEFPSFSIIISGSHVTDVYCKYGDFDSNTLPYSAYTAKEGGCIINNMTNNNVNIPTLMITPINNFPDKKTLLITIVEGGQYWTDNQGDVNIKIIDKNRPWLSQNKINNPLTTQFGINAMWYPILTVSATELVNTTINYSFNIAQMNYQELWGDPSNDAYLVFTSDQLDGNNVVWNKQIPSYTIRDMITTIAAIANGSMTIITLLFPAVPLSGDKRMFRCCRRNVDDIKNDIEENNINVIISEPLSLGLLTIK